MAYAGQQRVKKSLKRHVGNRAKHRAKAKKQSMRKTVTKKVKRPQVVKRGMNARSMRRDTNY